MRGDDAGQDEAYVAPSVPDSLDGCRVSGAGECYDVVLALHVCPSLAQLACHGGSGRHGFEVAAGAQCLIAVRHGHVAQVAPSVLGPRCSVPR